MMFRYGGKLLHEKKLTAGILSSFLLYMIQVGVAFAFLASLYGGNQSTVITTGWEWYFFRIHASGGSE